jgi:hypothetical protein
VAVRARRQQGSACGASACSPPLRQTIRQRSGASWPSPRRWRNWAESTRAIQIESVRPAWVSNSSLIKPALRSASLRPNGKLCLNPACRIIPMCEPRRPSPAFNLAVWRRPCPGVRRFARQLADLQAEAAQDPPMLNSTSSNLPRSCLRATRSARISRGLIDLACTVAKRFTRVRACAHRRWN